MNKIKRILIILVALVPILLSGCSSTGVDPLTGTYPVKVKNLTYLDLISEDLRGLRTNEAEMLESKPENLEIDFPYEQFSQVRFGSFNLGNNEKKIYLMLVNDGSNKDENYWTDLYFDQDLDYRITKKEKIKGLQTSQDSFQGIQRTQSFGLIPVSLQVSYKGLANQFNQKLYFFVMVNVYQKKELTDIVVNLIDAGFIEGELKILKGDSSRAVKFRIMDTNSNGCFNDYGTDLLFFDFDNDGFFRQAESQELAEYYTITHENVKEQLRMMVVPYPAKVAIVKANEAYPIDQLEPAVSIATNNEEKDAPIPTARPSSTLAPTPTGSAVEPTKINVQPTKTTVK